MRPPQNLTLPSRIALSASRRPRRELFHVVRSIGNSIHSPPPTAPLPHHSSPSEILPTETLSPYASLVTPLPPYLISPSSRSRPPRTAQTFLAQGPIFPYTATDGLEPVPIVYESIPEHEASINDDLTQTTSSLSPHLTPAYALSHHDVVSHPDESLPMPSLWPDLSMIPPPPPPQLAASAVDASVFPTFEIPPPPLSTYHRPRPQPQPASQPSSTLGVDAPSQDVPLVPTLAQPNKNAFVSGNIRNSSLSGLSLGRRKDYIDDAYAEFRCWDKTVDDDVTFWATPKEKEKEQWALVVTSLPNSTTATMLLTALTASFLVPTRIEIMSNDWRKTAYIPLARGYDPKKFMRHQSRRMHKLIQRKCVELFSLQEGLRESTVLHVPPQAILLPPQPRPNPYMPNRVSPPTPSPLIRLSISNIPPQLALTHLLWALHDQLRLHPSHAMLHRQAGKPYHSGLAFVWVTREEAEYVLKSVRGDDQEEGQGKTRKGKVVVGGEERLGKGARGEVELKITLAPIRSPPPRSTRPGTFNGSGMLVRPMAWREHWESLLHEDTSRLDVDEEHSGQRQEDGGGKRWERVVIAEEVFDEDEEEEENEEEEEEQDEEEDNEAEEDEDEENNGRGDHWAAGGGEEWTRSGTRMDGREGG